MNENKEEELELPSFLCPITQMRMVDPVILESGHTYERKAIEAWFAQGHKRDPLTNLPLYGQSTLPKKTSNFALKNSIQEYEAKAQEWIQTLQELETKQSEWMVEKEKQRNSQNHLLIQWCEDLLNSKQNYGEDDQLSNSMVRWYDMYKLCHGKMECLVNVFKRYVEAGSRIDLELLSGALESALLDVGLGWPVRVIQLLSQYLSADVPLFLIGKLIHQTSEKENYFHGCVRVWFHSESWGHGVVYNVFRTLINEWGERGSFARNCCKWVNDLLSSESVDMDITEQLIRVQLISVARIYNLLIDRDVFEQQHQLYFANRLINGRSKSMPLEQECIVILRKVGGYQWINKLQGMLNDIQKPHFHCQKSFSTSQLELNLKICTSGNWPCLSTTRFYAPIDLASTMEHVKHSYLWQFPGHRLMWQMDKGRAEVCVSFTRMRVYTLNVTTYQMMILLIFNDDSLKKDSSYKKKVSFRDILDITGVPEDEIGHHLLSFVHPKVRILLKRPNTKALKDDHQFMLNPNYTHPQKKVIVPLMQPLSSYKYFPRQEDEAAKEKTLEQQRQIDYYICCRMLSKGTVRHPCLVADVLGRFKSHFHIKPLMVKKRIEALIEQGYLKRDDIDRNVYHSLS